MISLYVDDQPLDLPEGASIDYLLRSPVFDPEVINGDRSYPIELSARSEQNRRVLGYPHRLDGGVQLGRLFDAEIRLNGATLIPGKLLVNEASSETYKVQLMSAAADLAPLKDTRLPETLRKQVSFGRVVLERRILCPQRYWSASLSIDFEGNAPLYLNLDGVTYSGPDVFQNHKDHLRDVRDAINSDPDAPVWAEVVGPYFNPVATPDAINPEIHRSNHFGLLLTERYEGATSFNYNNPTPPTGFHWEDLGVGELDLGYDPAPLIMADIAQLNLIAQTGDIRFPTVAEIRGTDESPETVLLNRWVDGFQIPLLHQARQSTLMPFFRLSYLLREALGSVGWSLIGDCFKERDLLNVFVAARIASRDGETRKDIDEGEVRVAILPHRIALRDYVPNISLGEILTAVRNNLGIGFFFDSRKRQVEAVRLDSIASDLSGEDFTTRQRGEENLTQPDRKGFLFEFDGLNLEDTAQQAYDNWGAYEVGLPVETALQLPLAGAKLGMARLVKSEGAFYRIELVAGQLAWVKLADNVMPLALAYSGTPPNQQRRPDNALLYAEESVVGKFVPLPIWRGEDPENAGRELTCPQVARTEEGDGDAVLRCAIWWGLKEDSNTDLYPYASAHNYDHGGTRIDNFSLGMYGPDGLFERSLERYYDALQRGQPFEMLVRMTLADFLGLSLLRAHFVRHQRFLIEEVALEIDQKGIALAQIKALRI